MRGESPRQHCAASPVWCQRGGARCGRQLKIEGTEQLSARQRCALVPALSGQAMKSSYVFHFQFLNGFIFFTSQNQKSYSQAIASCVFSNFHEWADEWAQVFSGRWSVRLPFGGLPDLKSLSVDIIGKLCAC